jgi:hypothetical protein
MSKLSEQLFSVYFLIILGLNPAACFKALKGCKSSGDNVVKAVNDPPAPRPDPTPLPQPDPPPRPSSDAGIHGNPGTGAQGADEFSTSHTDGGATFTANADETYTYRGNTYESFTEIPFTQGDQLYFDGNLSERQVNHLMRRGINFVFNRTIFDQRASPFKVIYMISNTVEDVMSLYEIDESAARKLIEMSQAIIENNNILKVTSPEELLQQQQSAKEAGQVPVLVFHNGAATRSLAFDPSSHLLTCNNYTLDVSSPVISVDYLDVEAVIKGIQNNAAYSNLGDFYRGFGNTYYNDLRQRKNVNTLLYMGGAIGAGGGAVAIVYYASES